MKRFLLLSIITLSTLSLSAQHRGADQRRGADYDSLLVRLEAMEAKLAEVERASESATKRQKETTQKKGWSRLTFGGYGEVTMSRHMYANAWQRYSFPSLYEDSEGYGRFDIPHAVFFIGYDFGRGWTFGTEIEFEHGGLEVAMEIEEEETGEYETEVENGGEIILEQFWINKEWSKGLNLKMGHLLVPVGMTNKYHMPTEYFGVFRPEGESSILPCAWHETGVSLWGRLGDWSYEVMFLAGLDSDRFSSADWIASGSGSPYEFKIANSYATAFRVDNRSVKDLTLALSGYYGTSASNTLKTLYSDDVKGAVFVGAFDARYQTDNLIVRGNFDYGTLGDSYEISYGNSKAAMGSPSPAQPVGSVALAAGAEAGYNVFNFFNKLKGREQKFFLFGRYEFYDSMFDTVDKVNDAKYLRRTCLSGGINYSPLKEIAIKMEYQSRRFYSKYNNENTLMLGVTYTGLFTR